MTKKTKKAEPRILITGQVREHCTMCGALPGFLHHDPSYRKGLVVLIKYKGQQLCQPCRQGAREAALDFKKVKGNPMTKKTAVKAGHTRGGKPIGDADGDMNPKRGQWARDAVEAFQDVTGLGEDDGLETAIGDLLADLAHLCDAEGISFAAQLDHAKGHYEAETQAERKGEVDGAQFDGITIDDDFEAEEAACREIIQGGKGGKL
jgi:hypothetical protein